MQVASFPVKRKDYTTPIYEKRSLEIENRFRIIRNLNLRAFYWESIKHYRPGKVNKNFGELEEVKESEYNLWHKSK